MALVEKANAEQKHNWPVVFVANKDERFVLGDTGSWLIDFEAVYSTKSRVPGCRLFKTWCVRDFGSWQGKKMAAAFKRRLNREKIERAIVHQIWPPMTYSLASQMTEFNKEMRAKYESKNETMAS